MDAVQSWLIVAANFGGAVAFLGMGTRLRNLLLVACGTGSLIAALLVAAQAAPWRITPKNPWAYALGFLASVIGFFELVRAYARQRRR